MKLVKKSDSIVILAILLISLVVWGCYTLYYSGTPVVAEIFYESRLVQTVDLGKKEDRIFSIPQNRHVVFHVFEDGSICFKESDCRDKICIRSGRIDTVGQSAACLPNKIVLKIVRKNNASDNDPDIVIG